MIYWLGGVKKRISGNRQAPVKRTRKPKGGSDNADGDEGTEVEKDTAGRVKLNSNAPGKPAPICPDCSLAQ